MATVQDFSTAFDTAFDLMLDSGVEAIVSVGAGTSLRPAVGRRRGRKPSCLVAAAAAAAACRFGVADARRHED